MPQGIRSLRELSHAESAASSASRSSRRLKHPDGEVHGRWKVHHPSDRIYTEEDHDTESNEGEEDGDHRSRKLRKQE